MHALRHPQRDLRAGNAMRPTSRSARRIRTRRMTGARGMPFALEPQQQRIAAELEQAAAARVGGLEDRLEDCRDRVGDLFGTFPALLREPFGQRREPGDVDKRRCAFAGPASACPGRSLSAVSAFATRTGRRARRRGPRSMRCVAGVGLIGDRHFIAGHGVHSGCKTLRF